MSTWYVQCAVCKMGVPWDKEHDKKFYESHGRYPTERDIDQVKTLCDRCLKEIRDGVNARYVG